MRKFIVILISAVFGTGCVELADITLEQCAAEPMRPAVREGAVQLAIEDIRLSETSLLVTARVSQRGFFGAVPVPNATVRFEPRDTTLKAVPHTVTTDTAGLATSGIRMGGAGIDSPGRQTVVIDVAATVATQEVVNSPMPVCVILERRSPSSSPTS